MTRFVALKTFSVAVCVTFVTTFGCAATGAQFYPIPSPEWFSKDEYKEVPSKTSYDLVGGSQFVTGDVGGTIFSAKGNDPTCATSVVNCARVCSDLPSGASLVRVEKLNDNQHYARFVGDPEYFASEPLHRVCMRVKSWATGAPRTFNFRIYWKVATSKK